MREEERSEEEEGVWEGLEEIGRIQLYIVVGSGYNYLLIHSIYRKMVIRIDNDRMHFLFPLDV